MAKPKGKQPKGGKKNRKHGRNRANCERYRREGRREKNKVRKLRNYVRRNPNDTQARSALKGVATDGILDLCEPRHRMFSDRGLHFEMKLSTCVDSRRRECLLAKHANTITHSATKLVSVAARCHKASWPKVRLYSVRPFQCASARGLRFRNTAGVGSTRWL